MEVKCNIPYPDIMVEKPSKEYAKILMNCYAGKKGEDSAIHLYIFEHLALNENYEYYSKIFERIAIVEMNHLRILGKTIRLLGIEPVFMSYDFNKNCFIPFNTNYINYKFNIIDMINENIKSEEEAIKNYKNAIKVIKDKYIIDILNRIVMDEELHLNIFNELKSKLNKK